MGCEARALGAVVACAAACPLPRTGQTDVWRKLIVCVGRAATQHRTLFSIDIGGQPYVVLVLVHTARMLTAPAMAAHWPFPVSGHERGASAQPWSMLMDGFGRLVGVRVQAN